MEKNITPHMQSFFNDAKTLFINEMNGLDVQTTFYSFHEKALECLDSLDKNVLQKGKDYLLSMLILIPNHPTPLYQLARIESLMQNVPQAISYLEKALENGYKDVTNISLDKELDNIKNTVDFQKLVEKFHSVFKNEVNVESEVVPENKIQDSVVLKEKIDTINSNLSDSYIDLRMKWSSQIVELKSMGFLVDDEVLSLLLEQSNGNIQEVMDILLKL